MQIDSMMFYWLAPLVVWDGIWKTVALWKSARHNQLGWFIALAVFNTIGILPIVYIFFFQPKSQEKKTD